MSAWRFWPRQAEARVASTRIRCLQVIDALRDQGADAALFSPGDQPRVLVLGKRYDEASIQQAQALRQRCGTRLVLDLCDNHFDAESDDAQWRDRAERLRTACRTVDRVVVSTDTLAEVVHRACDGAVLPCVVPDPLDLRACDPHDRGRADYLHALRLRWFARRWPVVPGRRLLWFGNARAAYAGGGMEDLGRVAEALARHHRKLPLSLVIVSNRWERFRDLRRDWDWPCLYLPWSGANFARALAHADVALIPVQRNAFTICKTNNRLATALMHGLAVAADALPSYEEFRDLAVLGDWHDGLATLMDDAAERARRVALGRERLVHSYAPEAVARQWAALLQALGGDVPTPHNRTS